MPRRKVDPADRVRAVRACVQCRSSKKRCNAQLPCSLCIRKGMQNVCTFHKAPASSVHAPDSPTNQAESTQEALENELPLQQNEDDEQLDNPLLGETQEDPPGEALHRINSRLLSSSRGDRVFIGSSASLAFLQFIRDLVAGSMGSSEFTHSPKASRMLEADQPIHDQISSSAELDIATRLQYGQNFSAVTAGIFGFANYEDVSHILTESTPSHTSHTNPLADLVLAIGAQCAPASATQATVEQECLTAAQAAAFSGMIESPSLDTIKVFLLLAFYMIQACRRNAAFMYLGIASRAAYVLGLPNLDGLPEGTQEEYSVLWKSLVNFDIIVSSILGRSTATLYQHDQHSNPFRETFIESSHEALDAAYGMSILVHGIVNDLYKNPSVKMQAAESYLDKLEDWAESLPPSLRLNEAPITRDHAALKHVSGCLNVSCYYHFAVILVCRPFLVSHLLHHLLRQKTMARSRSLQIISDKDVVRVDLAEKCVLAATYMAQTSNEVAEADFLLESAPLLKAWVFAAGLVLGLQMFALETFNSEVDSAFQASLMVLQKLGTRSSQAMHYFDILSHLQNVIAKKRERAAQSSRRGGKGVKKMINLFSRPRTPSSATSFDVATDSFFLPQGFETEFGSMNDLSSDMPHGTLSYDDVFLGWNQTAWPM